VKHFVPVTSWFRLDAGHKPIIWLYHLGVRDLLTRNIVVAMIYEVMPEPLTLSWSGP
jgi:hypothetical protein